MMKAIERSFRRERKIDENITKDEESSVRTRTLSDSSTNLSHEEVSDASEKASSDKLASKKEKSNRKEEKKERPKKSRSPSRHRARSPSRHKSRSPSRHKSRSPIRHKSRSPCRHQGRSPSRHKSRSSGAADHHSIKKSRSSRAVLKEPDGARGDGSTKGRKSKDPLKTSLHKFGNEEEEILSEKWKETCKREKSKHGRSTNATRNHTPNDDENDDDDDDDDSDDFMDMLRNDRAKMVKDSNNSSMDLLDLQESIKELSTIDKLALVKTLLEDESIAKMKKEQMKAKKDLEKGKKSSKQKQPKKSASHGDLGTAMGITVKDIDKVHDSLESSLKNLQFDPKADEETKKLEKTKKKTRHKKSSSERLSSSASSLDIDSKDAEKPKKTSKRSCPKKSYSERNLDSIAEHRKEGRKTTKTASREDYNSSLPNLLADELDADTCRKAWVDFHKAKAKTVAMKENRHKESKSNNGSSSSNLDLDACRKEKSTKRSLRTKEESSRTVIDEYIAEGAARDAYTVASDELTYFSEDPLYVSPSKTLAWSQPTTLYPIEDQKSDSKQHSLEASLSNLKGLFGSKKKK